MRILLLKESCFQPCEREIPFAARPVPPYQKKLGLPGFEGVDLRRKKLELLSENFLKISQGSTYLLGVTMSIANYWATLNASRLVRHQWPEQRARRNAQCGIT